MTIRMDKSAGTITTALYSSPAGQMVIGSFGNALCICDWTSEQRRAATARRLCHRLNARLTTGTSPIIELAISQLNEYFAGMRQQFSVPLTLTGSEFQCTVWNQLTEIPYAATITYAELARRIDNPKAARAVAAANAANPISIFIPCHRVIGSNNKLTGYAGGLEAKQCLLNLERRTAGLSAGLQMPCGETHSI